MQQSSTRNSNQFQQNQSMQIQSESSHQTPPEIIDHVDKKFQKNQQNKQIIKEEADNQQGLNLEQQKLLQSFLQLPYQFVPPPIITDLNTTAYRQNFQPFIQNNTSTYEMFRRKYFINSGKEYFPPQSEQALLNKQQPTTITPGPYPMKYDISKDQNIRVKVFNLKFTGYTMYSTMNEVIKNLCHLNLNTQRLKQLDGLLNQKLQNYYELAQEIKENYRRMFILYKLQQETAFLEKQTDDINQKLQKISQYISNNIPEGSMQNQQYQKDYSD